MTPDQQAALDQLSAITAAASDQERDRDERLLRKNGWNVEATVNEIFTGGGQLPTPSETQKAETESSTFASADGDMAPRRRMSGTAVPVTPRRQTTVGLGLWETIVWPFSVLASILTGTWYFFIRTFVPLSLLPHLPRFLLPPPSRAPPTGPRDPTTSSLRFVRDLETLTGGSSVTGNLPDFFVGPYREFLAEVRKQGKVGAVVLVSSEHENDEEFKRDVLSDPELVKCLKDNDILVWGADISSREGYMVAQTLLTTTYPSITFASLLPPASSSVSGSSSPRLTILTTVAGPPSTVTNTASLIQVISTQILPRTNAFLQRLRRERLRLEEARHLREEQDRAFREAERKDGERLAAQRQQRELERIQRERAEREAAAKAKAVEDRQQWRRYARKHLLPPNEGPVRVAVRTPLSAERHVRAFAPGPSTLPLFVYAETLLIPPEDEPAADPDSPPEGYEHAWDFRLVTHFPRRTVELTEVGGEEVWAMVKSAGGALFAEKIEGSAWGDAEKASTAGDSSDEEIVSDSD